MRVPPLVQLIIAVLVAFLLAMLVVVPMLNPPMEDIQNLFFYMVSSGLARHAPHGAGCVRTWP